MLAAFAVRADGQSNPKSLNLSSRPAADPYEFTVGDILSSTSDTNLYDPLTIQQLRLLKEDAQPSWDPDDIDPDKTRRVVEKAMAIELGRTLAWQIQRSELRDLYNDTSRALKRLQQRFRYSLQSDGNSLSVSRRKQGRKLLELNMEFNVKRGLDPQIRIGDSLRFRYDYLYDRTMLEYGFNF